MLDKIADQLYTIFVQTLDAEERHRFSFCWSYVNMPFNQFTQFTILCSGGRAPARYLRQPKGLGEVVEAYYEPERVAANQAIRALQHWITFIPPLERKAWYEGQLAWPGLTQNPEGLHV